MFVCDTESIQVFGSKAKLWKTLCNSLIELHRGTHLEQVSPATHTHTVLSSSSTYCHCNLILTSPSPPSLLSPTFSSGVCTCWFWCSVAHSCTCHWHVGLTPPIGGVNGHPAEESSTVTSIWTAAPGVVKMPHVSAEQWRRSVASAHGRTVGELAGCHRGIP